MALAPLLCAVAVLVGAVVVVGYDQLPSPPSVRVCWRQRRASGLQQVRGVLEGGGGGVEYAAAWSLLATCIYAYFVFTPSDARLCSKFIHLFLLFFCRGKKKTNVFVSVFVLLFVASGF